MRAGEERRARVRRKLREYFQACDESGKRYTLSGLKVALGRDAAQWDSLMADELLRPDVELAVERIRDALEQRGDTMAVMLRKELGGGTKPTGERLEVKFGEGGDDYGG